MSRNALSLSGLMLAAVLSVPACAQTGTPPIGGGFPGNKPVDLAGVYFGMSASQARPVIAAHYARQVNKSSFTMVRSAAAKEPFLRYAYGELSDRNAPSDILTSA